MKAVKNFVIFQSQKFNVKATVKVYSYGDTTKHSDDINTSFKIDLM